MTIINLDDPSAVNDKQPPQPKPSSQPLSTASCPTQNEPGPGPIIMQTNTSKQNSASHDWLYARDACAAKRAAGGVGYQDDIHANGTTSTSSDTNDYACGRGLGKW